MITRRATSPIEQDSGTEGIQTSLPSQHALQHAPAVTFDFHDGTSIQSNFDVMYTIIRKLLDRFYLECQVTVMSADPRYITPAVKAMLRHKNRLMRTGRIDEADALALRVRKVITRHNTKWLRDIDAKKNAKDAWAKI